MTRITGVRTAHLITGAPAAMWRTALCRDIFHGNTVDPEELCGRRFPRGSRRTCWDYPLEGGHDRHPDRVPARMTTALVRDPVELSGPGGVWELRAVAVEIDAAAQDVPFNGGWPNGVRPADAGHPL